MINLGFKLVCGEVCGGLWWFVVWFVVVCGSLWWFVVVCGGLWCLVPPVYIIPTFAEISKLLLEQNFATSFWS